MSQTTAAYVAGLIDGEGCIGITVNNRNTQPTYNVRIEMGMSEKAKPLLSEMHKKYGGTFTLLREATARWEAAWQWRVLDRSECRCLLEMTVPHLRLKSEQADLALRLIRMVDGLPTTRDGKPKWTPEARRDAECIRAQVMGLNQKGPTVTPQAGGFARYVGGQWITDQRSLFSPTGWEKFSSTWPAAGTMRNGQVYLRPPLVPRTFVGESSLWPTMTVPNGGGRGTDDNPRGVHQGHSLTVAANLWPTPTQSDGMGGPGSSGRDGGENLRTAIGGQLNPTWVEPLMGFPAGWTDISGEG